MNQYEQTKLIYEAFTKVLTESVTSKFKVGDKVGIGSHGWDGYSSRDTGTVVKVDKAGNHLVQHDNNKSFDDSSKPYIAAYDSTGKSKSLHFNDELSPIDDHNKQIAKTTSDRIRTNDLNKVLELLQNHKFQTTNKYAKLSLVAAKHIKELVDKHTSEE